MTFFYKSAWKYVFGFSIIILITLGGLVLSDYYFNPERGKEDQALEELKELQRQYEEDTYGGSTPEETLELFIMALEAGDIELASKYFVLDKQEEWGSNLLKIKQKNLLNDMVSDLNRIKYKNEISSGQITFSIANDENEVALTILMGRNSSSDVWKIVDM